MSEFRRRVAVQITALLRVQGLLRFAVRKLIGRADRHDAAIRNLTDNADAVNRELLKMMKRITELEKKRRKK